MKVKIDVDTKTFIRFLMVVTAFVAAVFIIWKAWPALMLIGVAFFLAVALNPPVSALASRIPGHSRVIATSFSYLVVLSVLGVFIYIALPPVVDQTTNFINALPSYVQELSNRQGLVADFINRYNLQEQLNQLVSGAQQQTANVAQGIGTSVVNGVSSILSGFITLITVLVLAFIMLIEGPMWMQKMWHLYEDEEKLRRHQRVMARMYKVVSGYVNGQVVVAGIASVAALTTLLIQTYFFNVPVSAAIPLAGIIFLTSLIPMVGATLGAVIVVVVLLFNDVAAAFTFLAYFLIYQQIENNFIQPVVQSRTVQLSALGVFVAVIIGITLMGLVGGIIAIPIAGCIRVILLDYMEHRKRKPKPKSGIVAKIVNATE